MKQAKTKQNPSLYKLQKEVLQHLTENHEISISSIQANISLQFQSSSVHF